MEWDAAADDWYMDHVVLARDAGETGLQTTARVLATRLAASGPVGELAAGQGFVVTTAQALNLGVTVADIRRRLRRGEWTRPRHGVLAPFSPVPGFRPLLAASAAALTRSGDVISGRSAALLFDLPTMPTTDRPSVPVELTATTSGHFRRVPGLRVTTAYLAPEEITRWYGAPVTTIGRTVSDLARADRRDGLIAADAALRSSRATADSLSGAVRRSVGQSGVSQAREIVALASPLSESPLESVTRLLIYDAGLPVPELQVWITDPADGWRARVDGLWRDQRVILEADGRVKYRNDELWREKLRQERLEQLGYRVIRVQWTQVVSRPAETIRRLRSALALKTPDSRGVDGPFAAS